MNIRQVRTKIKSIGNVKKITKAMQLVSSVKMRKAQQQALEGRPYRETLEEIIGRILPKVDARRLRLLQEQQISKKKSLGGGKELVILISSNKGLAGAFNINLFRTILKDSNFEKIEFVTMGKKGTEFVSRMGKKIIADYTAGESLSEISAIFSFVLKKFLDREYVTVSVIFNRFISTLRSETVKEKLLPVEVGTKEKQQKAGEYLVEPTGEAIIESLLSNFVEEKIRGAFLNSEAAEHSARMIAMKNATDNANDVIYNLTLLRNKLRQQKITYELLDMITAKESVG
ncbi:MAG: ATP synthase F1 subunit gamma [Candidatus Roizmanbacteria bacterium]|nr:MAG: ATP synthase F1 subunit gamma [Candidatus Roizmanbacteria bacterium]